MKKTGILLLSLAALYACKPSKTKADLLIHHARIYAVDSAFTVYEAMAVKDGKILELNSNESILDQYEAPQIVDVKGKPVFPGFIDAHCHFLGYGLGLQEANLVGTRSFNDVLQRLQAFAKAHPSAWLVGRSWDQNDWDVKEFPERRQLDSLFPNTPVFLERIDGHAALANKEALLQAGIDGTTQVKGGVVSYKFTFDDSWTPENRREEIKHMGYPYPVPTGLLLDNAVELVKRVIPKPDKAAMERALLAAQKNCFEVGLTTISDAGLMAGDVALVDELQKAGKLNMRIYAMLSDSAPNYKAYLDRGPYKTDRLHVCSFKFYADGALGSRGACLLQDYSDKAGWKGFLLSSPEHFREKAMLLAAKGFQVNTHCIGDSTVQFTLHTYLPYLRANTLKPGRWRIEHFQITTPQALREMKAVGFDKTRQIIPSIQPTHATSDMYWAGERLGKERMRYAYAYKELLNTFGIVALGTDFPVEDISPFKTFYAAVYRKDSKGFPEGGFQMSNALTREETLRGMTIWAAYANCEEQEKGSLEKGKLADFVILDTDLMTCGEAAILKTNVLATYSGGEAVYQK